MVVDVVPEVLLLMMSCCCWSSVPLQAQLLELARHLHCPVLVLWVEFSLLGSWIRLLSELGLYLSPVLRLSA